MTYNDENPVQQMSNIAVANIDNGQLSDKITKEFSVLKLIDAYRTRGHLFTETNPVRERRLYTPTLELENFGLFNADLNTVFDAAKILGHQPQALQQIVAHLKNVYCQHIGIEYMYIRNPEVIQWIQDKLNINDNLPNFDTNQKKIILEKS